MGGKSIDKRKAAKNAPNAEGSYDCAFLIMLLLAAVAWASFMIYMYAFITEYVFAADTIWSHIGIGLAAFGILLIEGALLFVPDIWWFFLALFALWLTVAAIFGIMVVVMLIIGASLGVATLVLIAIHTWQVYK